MPSQSLPSNSNVFQPTAPVDEKIEEEQVRLIERRKEQGRRLQLKAREEDLRYLLELRDRKAQIDELEYNVRPFPDPLVSG